MSLENSPLDLATETMVAFVRVLLVVWSGAALGC